MGIDGGKNWPSAAMFYVINGQEDLAMDNEVAEHTSCGEQPNQQANTSSNHYPMGTKKG